MDPWEKFIPENYGARVPSCFSWGRLFATPWTVARQAPLSMRFSGQEYWSGLSFPSPGDLPNAAIKHVSPATAGGFFTAEPQGSPSRFPYCYVPPAWGNSWHAGGLGLVSGSGRSPGGGCSNPLQYSCLENPMDRGAWRATVHGVTKSQTQLSY